MITIQLDVCLLQMRQILEREFNWLLASGTDREVLDEVRYLFYSLTLKELIIIIVLFLNKIFIFQLDWPADS